MVEVEGIEPSSRDKKTRTSTHLACLFYLVCFLSDRQDRKQTQQSFYLVSPSFAKGKTSPAFMTPLLLSRAKSKEALAVFKQPEPSFRWRLFFSG